ncbi:MAG: DedA family protein [Gammaproteobacteria bacterium]|nr:DedA family protein [Gammaproteobacteria bacterium]MYD78501.1 DedA family protein [Gammaproteobacteria bacterium]
MHIHLVEVCTAPLQTYTEKELVRTFFQIRSRALKFDQSKLIRRIEVNRSSSMLKFDQFYDRMLKLASHRHAPAYLAGVSFTEAVLVPIPPDMLLIPMALAKKSHAWRFAFLTTLSSVLGGLVGYLIGMFLYDSVGRSVIEFYALDGYFSSMAEWYADYGIWIVLVSGFLPIPYKVFTIASGVFAMAVIPFLVGSIIGRATRFYAVSAICYLLGDAVYKIMKRYTGPAMVVLSLLLVFAFVYSTIN